jgi:hypothetical protein
MPSDIDVRVNSNVLEGACQRQRMLTGCMLSIMSDVLRLLNLRLKLLWRALVLRSHESIKVSWTVEASKEL